MRMYQDSHSHPDDETLAAFLDARLEPKEREQLLEHVDACQRCFELLAEIAATLEDPPAAVASAPRVPAAIATTGSKATPAELEPRFAGRDAAGARVSWRPARWLVAAAAAMALASTATWMALRSERSGIGRLVAELEAPAAELAGRAFVDVGGGVAGFAGRDREGHGVLAGARLADLLVARQGALGRARIEPICRDLARLDAQAGVVCPDVAAVEQRLSAAFDGELVELGAWVEVVRLAALTGDTRLVARQSPPAALADSARLSGATLEREALVRTLAAAREQPTLEAVSAVADAASDFLAVQ